MSAPPRHPFDGPNTRLRPALSFAIAGTLLLTACSSGAAEEGGTAPVDPTVSSATEPIATTPPAGADEPSTPTSRAGAPVTSPPTTTEPDTASDERVGYELLERMDDGTLRAWVSADPMTLEEFKAIDLPDDWFKNQPRESSVDGGRFLGSPGADGVTVYEDHFGHRWFHSATVVQVGVPVDDEGLLSGAIVEKSHEISYDRGSTVITLVSPDGDTYVRIGRDAGRASDEPTLPTGWEIVEIEVPDGYTTVLPDGTLVIRTDNQDSFQGPVIGL